MNEIEFYIVNSKYLHLNKRRRKKLLKRVPSVALVVDVDMSTIRARVNPVDLSIGYL